MKFSVYATTLLLLNGLSGSHARMGSRSLEEDDEPGALSQLVGAILGPILEVFPFIEDIPVLGDIISDVYADSLTYDEIVARVLTDFGYAEIPDPLCNRTWETVEDPDNTFFSSCDSDGKLTFIALSDYGEGKPPSGFISTFIGSLPELSGLWVQTESDHLNYGALPTEIGQLTVLEQLYMFSTGLTGAVPDEISSLKELKYLAFDDNPDLTGTIPGGFDNLSTLSLDSTGISDFDDAYCDILNISYEDSAVPEDKCPEAKAKQDNIFDH